MNTIIYTLIILTVLILLYLCALIFPTIQNKIIKDICYITGWFFFLNSLNSMIVLNCIFYGFQQSVSGRSTSIPLSSKQTLFYILLTLMGFTIGTLITIISAKTDGIIKTFNKFKIPLIILTYIVLSRFVIAHIFNIPKGNPHLSQEVFNIEYLAGIVTIDIPVIYLILQIKRITKLRIWSIGLLLWIIYCIFTFYHITSANYASIMYGSILLNMFLITFFITLILTIQIIKNKNKKRKIEILSLKPNRLKYLYEYISNNYFAVSIFLLITFVLTNLMKEALEKNDYMIIVNWFLDNIQTTFILTLAILLPLLGALFWHSNDFKISSSIFLNPKIKKHGLKQLMLYEGGYLYIVLSVIVISFSHILILIKKIAEKI